MPRLHFIKAGLLTALLAGAAMPALAQPGGDRQGAQNQRGGESRASRPAARPADSGNRASAARPAPAPRIADRAAQAPRVQRDATPRPGTPAARPQAPNAAQAAPPRPGTQPPAQATPRPGAQPPAQATPRPGAQRPGQPAPPRPGATPGQGGQNWQNNGPRTRPDGDRARPNDGRPNNGPNARDRDRDRPNANPQWRDRDRPGGPNWRDNDRNRPGSNWRPPNNRPPTTTRPPNRPPVVNRWQGYHPWANTWRNDRRYDWQYWRRTNRDVFRMPHYYAPYGWNQGYFRFSIGTHLNDLLFGASYWIDDPYRYRLPPAYGYLRWVRYYDDALLVDIRDGYVVDIVYDVFW